MEEIDESIEETLVEMAYRWGDIEEALPGWYRPAKGEFDDDERVGSELAAALGEAFRVEAACESGLNDFGEPWARFRYEALFDVERREAREGAHTVRTNLRFLENVIKKLSGGQARDVSVRVVSPGTAAEGQVCGRPFEPPPKTHLDVADVPDEKPDSNVPLERIDGYWLTPIEVPFYKALRETGLVFAVQPWIQGVESRFRLDFLVFYDGGMVAVELDGHESHKSKEQRLRDARRDRWFEARKVRTLRWTGSEVHASPQECVRELLEIVRGRQARV
jgi:very-short-patch-repair endonuclease